MLQHQSEGFLGQEINNCLNNLQTLFNKAKPWTKKLVIDEKLSETIIKYVKTLQTLLCEVQDNHSEWEREQNASSEAIVDNWPSSPDLKKIKSLMRLYHKRVLCDTKVLQEINNIVFRIEPSINEHEYKLVERLYNEHCISKEEMEAEMDELDNE